jgi:Acetyltransferase (GNAT) family
MIRVATTDDHYRCVEMGIRFAEASPYADLQVDEAKVHEMVHTFISAPNDKKIILLLLNELEYPVGMVLGTIEEFLFNRKKIAAEVAWWVDPEFRGRNSVQLLEAYEYWATMCKADVIQMSLLHDEHQEKLDKLYKRKDYVPTETGYIKRTNV